MAAAQFTIKCQQLVKSSVKLLHNFNPTSPLKQQIDKSDVVRNLDIGYQFHGNIGKNIGVFNIFSHPNLRISVFHIPHGITMKLHNHPKMHVITYILQGSMQAKIFNKHLTEQELYTKTEIMLRKGEMSLTQESKDNLHQFNATQEKCSFLDIIFPDYNETDRICQYFDHTPTQTASGQKLYKLIKLRHDYYDEMCQI